MNRLAFLSLVVVCVVVVDVVVVGGVIPLVLQNAATCLTLLAGVDRERRDTTEEAPPREVDPPFGRMPATRFFIANQQKLVCKTSEGPMYSKSSHQIRF